MIPPRQPYRIAQICATRRAQSPPPGQGGGLHHDRGRVRGAAGPVIRAHPTARGPSIYKEHLEKHGEGLHHLAVVMPTLAEADVPRDHFAQNGIGVSMEGKLGEEGGPGEYCYFYYMDTEPQLKFVLESHVLGSHVLESGSDAEQPADAVRQSPPAS